MMLKAEKSSMCYLNMLNTKLLELMEIMNMIYYDTQSMNFIDILLESAKRKAMNDMKIARDKQS